MATDIGSLTPGLDGHALRLEICLRDHEKRAGISAISLGALTFPM
jgi:hypothetical protein